MSEPVNLRILDREYLVACPPDERDSLLSAAQLVDSRLRDVRNAHRSATLDRWAVLVALNLANELGQLQRQLRQRDSELERSLEGLTQRLDGLLAQTPSAGQSALPLRDA
ncbi:MAG: cell division protein ZapA [Lysobacteraceae bacterium]